MSSDTHLSASTADTRTPIAPWFGHESLVTTHLYVEADLPMKKERALTKLHEPNSALQRYRVPDSLIDFLKTL